MTETDNQLTKLTVNLLPEAYEAMVTVASRTGMTRTDTINRALIMAELTSRPVPAGHWERIIDADNPSLVLYKASRKYPTGFWTRVRVALAGWRLP